MFTIDFNVNHTQYFYSICFMIFSHFVKRHFCFYEVLIIHMEIWKQQKLLSYCASFLFAIRSSFHMWFILMCKVKMIHSISFAYLIRLFHIFNALSKWLSTIAITRSTMNTFKALNYGALETSIGLLMDFSFLYNFFSNIESKFSSA